MLRSIIGSTPILWFGTRASNALWAEGAVMYSGPQLFCFWTLTDQIWLGCSPTQGLSENAEKSGPKFTDSEKIGFKVETLTPKISSPKRFWGQILAWAYRELMGLPYFQNWGTPHLPAIFGDFFFKMLILTLKISKSKLWPPKSRPPKGFGSKFWHGSLWAYLTFKIGGPPIYPQFLGIFFFKMLILTLKSQNRLVLFSICLCTKIKDLA